MKALIFLFVIFSFSGSGCDTQHREKAFKLKEAELRQREQELMLREQNLQVREEEVVKRENRLDSTSISSIDTLSARYPTVTGLWNVTMRCTETTCPGSAVGDTKTEQWVMSFENNKVVVKAMSDNKLLRIYNGTYTANAFELTAQQENVAGQQAAKMVLRLQLTKEAEMTGQREIIRPNDCHIVYALELRKQ